MKIRFWSLDEFVEEVKARLIKTVYRDFVTSSKMVGTSNEKIGKIPMEMLKIVLTATDGKDILTSEYMIFRSFYVDEEAKKKVRELMDKWDNEILPQMFPQKERITVKHGAIESL